jgi:uncharacterized protein
LDIPEQKISLLAVEYHPKGQVYHSRIKNLPIITVSGLEDVKQMSLQAINTTKNITIAGHVKIANHYFSRLIGLMGQKPLEEGNGLWIVPCRDIHSFFMRFVFDAIFVDKHLKVVYLKKEMKPWQVSRFVRQGHAVLELPAGTIEQTQTEVGDQLKLIS